jgi:hypothetical protein
MLTSRLGLAVELGEAQQQVDQANASLQAGSPTAAIERLELLADRGFLHPDVSFNRAIAYLTRADSKNAVAGDSGKAAAALSETLALRPSDPEAERLLETVQERIAKQHAGKETLGLSRPPLGLVLVELLPERAWAAMALLGTWLAVVGLGLRRWSSHHTLRLAGTITGAVSAGLCLLGLAMILGRSHLLRTTRQAVVVSATARLLDAAGRPLPGKASLTTLPEGAEVVVLESGDRRHHVSTGERDGWIAAEQLHLLPSRL